MRCDAPSLDEIQDEAIAGIAREREQGRSSTLMVMPTGTGKTTTVLKYVKSQIEQNGRSLVVAHTRKLVDQWSKTARRLGIPCEVEMESSRGIQNMLRPNWYQQAPRLCIASLDTYQGARLAACPRDFFGTVIFDEAHRSLTDKWRRVREHHERAFLVGSTATAFRNDRRSLGLLYDSVAYEYALPDAILAGHLVPLREIRCKTDVDLRDLRVDKETLDFRKGDLEDRISRSIDPLCNAVRQEFERLGITYGVVFTPDVASAHAFADGLQAIGISARSVSCKQNDTDLVLAQFEARQFRVLVNCSMLVEGYDAPWIEAVVIARPTKSPGFFSQMCGRVCRLNEGKQFGYIIHPAWIGAEHDLVTTVDLFVPAGMRLGDVAAAKERMESGAETDPMAAVEDAEAKRASREEAERQAARRKLKVHVREHALYYGRIVRDPVGLSRGRLRELEQASHEPALPIQMAMLREYGVPDQNLAGLTRYRARLELALLAQREKDGLATAGQVERLVGLGYERERALEMSIGKAKSVLDASWKRAAAF
jgi:superfamily II DNA or RNA helicase